jgi:hypothetical protein
MKKEELVINGITYIPKDSVKTNLESAKKLKGLPYVLIRGDRSGVFVGYLKEEKDREAILLQSRRIWYWDGASSISQLATDGTTKPQNCKFPCEVTEIKIKDVIEIISCTEKARLSIASVKVWEQ